MEEAQALVEKLSEPILLAVWEQNGQKRILDKTLNLHQVTWLRLEKLNVVLMRWSAFMYVG